MSDHFGKIDGQEARKVREDVYSWKMVRHGGRHSEIGRSFRRNENFGAWGYVISDLRTIRNTVKDKRITSLGKK